MSELLEWHYLLNSEEIATRESFKKMLVIDNYQTAGLNFQVGAHGVLAPWIARRLPFSTAFRNDYNFWTASGGIHEGQSLTLAQRFTLATKQLNTIDLGIQTIPGGQYAKGTPNYVTVLMDGHYKFTTGAIETRINEWQSFADRMGTDINLAPFKIQAMAIFVSLTGIRNSQTGSISNTNVLSSNLETSRVNLANIDYRNLGCYMDAFWDNHALILALCDTETIREHLQSKFTGTLTISEVEGILKHGFLDTDTFTAENTTDAPYALNLGSVAHGTDSTQIIIAPHTKVTITISMFGAIDLNLHRFLTVTNLSGAIASHYIIQL